MAYDYNNPPKRLSGSPAPRKKREAAAPAPYEAPKKHLRGGQFSAPAVTWSPNKKFTKEHYNGE